MHLDNLAFFIHFRKERVLIHITLPRDHVGRISESARAQIPSLQFQVDFNGDAVGFVVYGPNGGVECAAVTAGIPTCGPAISPSEAGSHHFMSGEYIADIFGTLANARTRSPATVMVQVGLGCWRGFGSSLRQRRVGACSLKLDCGLVRSIGCSRAVSRD